MKRISYNIADNKKIDKLKFTFYSAIVVMISLVFLALGIRNLWSIDQQERQQKEQAIQDRLELEKLTQENAQREEKVAKRKVEWKAQVDFSNWLINEKQFSVIGKLELLEKNLPEGAFFTQVNLDRENSSILRIGIAADSLPRLIETYHNFAAYQPEIQDEKEDEGLLKAGLVLHFKIKSQKPVAAENTKQKPKEQQQNNDDYY
jgi:cell division protein FtsL